MSWTPLDEPETGIRDPRLDPFRERAGILRGDGDEEEAHVFLRVATAWARASGHLWWSRWSTPREIILGYIRYGDGRFADWLSSGDGLEVDLGDWLSGSFHVAGSAFRVVWQDDAESTRVRDEVFGLD